jgi:hypothetical protein
LYKAPDGRKTESELKTEEMPFDKRRHRRRNTVSAVEYDVASLIADETFDGVIVNDSESGLCMLTTTPLLDNEKIILRNAKYSIPQIASVRWINNYNNLYYRVGLEFFK